jgi:hypothetical protein
LFEEGRGLSLLPFSAVAKISCGALSASNANRHKLTKIMMGFLFPHLDRRIFMATFIFAESD